MIALYVLFSVVTVLASLPANVVQPSRINALLSTSPNTSFATTQPKISYHDHCIFMLLKSHAIMVHKPYRTNRLLSHLIMILLAQSNDIHLNPGPSVNHENGDRIYLCGTCDDAVTWDHKGIICETCDQWYHAECQNLHSQTYDRLSDSRLNVSWHCIICSSPNYTTVVHDLYRSEVSHCSSTIGSVPDLSTSSPEPNRHRLQPMHSSTPTRSRTQQAKPQTPLRILNINFQSIKMKQCRLSNILDSVKPDIVIGTETWLEPNIKNSEIFPAGYKIHRKDRTKSGGGGVLLAIKNELNSEEVPDLDSDCEIIWSKIRLVGTGTLYLCSYYRYNVSDEESINQFEQSLTRASSIQNAQFIIGGDFNFPGFDWKTNQLKNDTTYPNLHRKFSEIIDNNSLTQVVQEPTRRNNTLDLMLTNRPNKILRVDILPGISDHDIVFAELDMRPIKYKQKPRSIPLYRKAKWDNIREDLKSLTSKIKDLYDSCAPNVNEMWETFRETISDSVKNNIPHRQTRHKDGYPWIGPDLKRLIKKQGKLYKTKKKTGDPYHKQRYLDIKHQVQKLTRQAYWTYIEDIVTPKEDDQKYTGMKRFWTYIKHKRNDNCGVSSLKSGGKLSSDPIEKANLLNKQFQSAFSSNATVTQNEFDQIMPPNQDTIPEIHDLNITLNGIVKLLKNLNSYKAAGPDNISPRVLKELASDIGPILLLIYRKSLHTSIIPDDWRTANVTPVYKKGPKFLPENYRPISLTSVCCKVMEHVIASTVMNFGETNKILYPLQHGFRKMRSCETQLIEFIDDISSNMQQGKQTDILVMDFAKAFDKVSHSLLIHKLNRYGIKGKINKWIESWLSGRRQKVVVDGEQSDFISVESGVPQGSVLGPGLFLYYINDIADGLKSKARLFADDTIDYMAISSEADAQTLQEDLDKLAAWELNWKMKFHPDKCNVLTVTNKRNKIQNQYQLHGHILQPVTSAKYLGVTATNSLRWDSHITEICTKANRTLGFLRRNINIISRTIKEQAYFTLVRPLVEYASPVWDPYTETSIHKLEMVQRRAARYVLNRQRNTSSVSSMLHTLNWRSLQDRRKDARLCMLYRIDRDLVAITKANRLEAPQRKTRHDHTRAYKLLSSRIDARKMSFFPRTVRDWNALPPDIVEADTLDAFKARVAAIKD